MRSHIKDLQQSHSALGQASARVLRDPAPAPGSQPGRGEDECPDPRVREEDGQEGAGVRVLWSDLRKVHAISAVTSSLKASFQTLGCITSFLS